MTTLLSFVSLPFSVRITTLLIIFEALVIFNEVLQVSITFEVKTLNYKNITIQVLLLAIGYGLDVLGNASEGTPLLW